MKKRTSGTGGKKEKVRADIRTSLSAEEIRRSIMKNLCYVVGRLPVVASRYDWYMALAYTVRDLVLERWMKTMEAYMEKNVKSLSYLSAEFLVGPHLMNNIIKLL